MKLLKKIIDFLKKPNVCKHGVIETEQHCPLCFGYRTGAIAPTSAPYIGKKDQAYKSLKDK